MTYPNMLTTYFPKAFLISTFIIFLTIIPISNAGNDYYKVCSSLYSCGNVKNVGYPFNGENIPTNCGRSEFTFDCLEGNDYPCLYIGENTHAKVTNINTSTHKMILVLEQFLNNNPPLCLSPDMNKCFEYLTKSGAYKLSSNKVNTNITLFYRCPNSISKNHSDSRTLFHCNFPDETTPTDGRRRRSTFFYVENLQTVHKYAELCHGKFYVPVLKKELDEFRQWRNSSILNDVLKKGFEMEYVANFTACSICQKSHGSCGSDEHSNEFVCYCRNGGRQSLRCISTKSGIMKLIIEISVPLTIGIGVAILFMSLKKKKPLAELICSCDKDSKKKENVETFLKRYESISPKRYNYTEIRRMTNNFKDKLGEGGFGSVFKGQLIDGRVVAVKLISKSNSEGEEFMNEVASIGRTNHVNIVSLLGFCYQGQKRALVYEFMANGSLEKFIYDGSIGHLLSWQTLFDICIGIARGLDYLHRGCTTRILHLDIKPHNILLDDEFHPKISDFGLARLCPKKQSIVSMAEARGTIGYIAPEICCPSLGGTSHKSDVYSFGMMVLEMVGGRKKIRTQIPNSDGSYFPQWINDALELTLDNSLQHDITNNDGKELKRKMVIVSLWCIQTNPSSRPSMNRVVEMLEGNLDLLQMPSMPSMCSPPRSVLSSDLHFSSGFNVDSNEYPMNFSTTR